MHQATFTKDETAKTMTVERSFAAPRSRVWAAWTTKELLDKWWGPAPWHTETKEMDFREGGHWLYAMVGPNGEKHWARADYIVIEPERRFTGEDGFCNEEGILDPEMPRMHWDVKFEEQGSETQVRVVITYPTFEDMRKTIEMGFEQGFTVGLAQLEELLTR